MSRNWLPERLPEDVEAERSFLATCCAPGSSQNCAETVFGLDDGVFVHPGYLAVFKALKRLLIAGLEVSSLTLKDELERSDELGKVGGYPGLVEVLAGEDVEHPWVLAKILDRKWRQRRLVHLGAQLVRDAAEETDDPEALVDRAAAALDSLVQVSQEGNLEEVGSDGDDWLIQFEDEIEGRKSAGLKVGFPKFDWLTQGFKPGNLIILGARPGIGKTALALNWLLRVAHAGHFGAFFSLEMSRKEVKARLISDQGGLDLRAIKRDRDESKISRVARAHQEINELPIYISDRAGITVREITAQCNRLKARRGRLDLVVVDYLQLISSPDESKRKNEAIRIGEITRGLKIYAKDAHVPVVVLSQLNREVEHRSGGRPQLSDLRESGAIEQDADLVAFLHRAMAPKEIPEDIQAQARVPLEPEPTELIVAKHRDGQLGVIHLHFHGQFTRYSEVERHTAVLPIQTHEATGAWS